MKSQRRNTQISKKPMKKSQKKRFEFSSVLAPRIGNLFVISFFVWFYCLVCNNCQLTIPDFESFSILSWIFFLPRWEKRKKRKEWMKKKIEDKVTTDHKRVDFNNFKSFWLSFQSAFHLSLAVLVSYRSPTSVFSFRWSLPPHLIGLGLYSQTTRLVKPSLLLHLNVPFSENKFYLF